MCVSCSDRIVFDFSFVKEKSKLPKKVQIEANVMRLKEPLTLILGRQSIKDLNLMIDCPESMLRMPSKTKAAKAAEYKIDAVDTLSAAMYSEQPREGQIAAKTDLLDIDDDDDEIETPSPNFIEVESIDDIVSAADPNSTLGKQLRKLFLKYEKNFSTTVQKTPALVSEPMNLTIDVTKWESEARNRAPPRPASREKRDEIARQIEELLKNDCIELSQSSHYSQVHLVKKSNGTWRFCIDFRGLNDSIKSMGWPIPNIKLLLQALGGKKKRRNTLLAWT
jgi:hypothetical protein